MCPANEQKENPFAADKVATTNVAALATALGAVAAEGDEMSTNAHEPRMVGQAPAVTQREM
jgi:hypothetical protein